MNIEDIKFIYIPGGPGLNSFAEQQLLGKTFPDSNLEIDFWNEPKTLSTQNLYEEILNELKKYIQSQTKPIILIGHSWGSYLSSEIVQTLDEKVKACILVSPAVNLEKSNQTIINVGLNILESTQPEIAKQLESLIPDLTNSFDDKMGEAILLAFQSGYFVKNFHDQKNFEKVFSYLTGDNEFRVMDFLSIRKSEAKLPRDRFKTVSTPCLSIIGTDDPVFTLESESETLKKFYSNIEIELWDNQSHYPHIEDTDKFISTLKKFIESL